MLVPGTWKVSGVGWRGGSPAPSSVIPEGCSIKALWSHFGGRRVGPKMVSRSMGFSHSLC